MRTGPTEELSNLYRTAEIILWDALEEAWQSYPLLEQYPQGILPEHLTFFFRHVWHL